MNRFHLEDVPLAYWNPLDDFPDPLDLLNTPGDWALGPLDARFNFDRRGRPGHDFRFTHAWEAIADESSVVVAERVVQPAPRERRLGPTMGPPSGQVASEDNSSNSPQAHLPTGILFMGECGACRLIASGAYNTHSNLSVPPAAGPHQVLGEITRHQMQESDVVANAREYLHSLASVSEKTVPTEDERHHQSLEGNVGPGATGDVCSPSAPCMEGRPVSSCGQGHEHILSPTTSRAELTSTESGPHRDQVTPTSGQHALQPVARGDHVSRETLTKVDCQERSSMTNHTLDSAETSSYSAPVKPCATDMAEIEDGAQERLFAGPTRRNPPRTHKAKPYAGPPKPQNVGKAKKLAKTINQTDDGINSGPSRWTPSAANAKLGVDEGGMKSSQDVDDLAETATARSQKEASTGPQRRHKNRLTPSPYPNKSRSPKKVAQKEQMAELKRKANIPEQKTGCPPTLLQPIVRWNTATREERDLYPYTAEHPDWNSRIGMAKCRWDNCASWFPDSKKGLELHMKRAHYTSMKQLKCRWGTCTGTGKTISDIKRHVKGHVGYYHPCDVPGCEAIYSRKCALTRHEKATHKKAGKMKPDEGRGCVTH